MDELQRFIVKVAIVAIDEAGNQIEEVGSYTSSYSSADTWNLSRILLELTERGDEAMMEEIAEGDLFEYDAPDPVHG